MSEPSYLLSIDNGTQSVRALLFDTNGNLLAKGKVELDPYFSSQPGWAEQDPEYYWASVGEACRLLWQQVDIDRSQIKGVAVTTQRGSIIHVDEQGAPLRPAMLWLDQRRAEVQGRIKGLWGWLFKLARAEEAVDHFRGQAEVNWVAQHQPDIAARTHKVLLLSGFLTQRLCGRFVDSASSCVAYLPFDYKRLRWAAPGARSAEHDPGDRRAHEVGQGRGEDRAHGLPASGRVRDPQPLTRRSGAERGTRHRHAIVTCRRGRAGPSPPRSLRRGSGTAGRRSRARR